VGLLRREISAGSILLARAVSLVRTKNKWGALIDFDFAREDDAAPSPTPERTGYAEPHRPSTCDAAR
jgi:hypothetical protein